MFDETQPQTPQVPMSGPPPGEPLGSMGAPTNRVPVASMVSPERTPPLPPLPPEPRMTGGGSGRGKKLLLWLIIALIVVGGGVAAAALLFPTGTPTGNENVAPNANAANANRLNSNGTYPYGTNASANKNTAAANANASSNVNVAATNVNATLNANATGTVNTNGNVNTGSSNASQNSAALNTNAAGRPASYTTDTDGDALNDYLEQWLQTSTRNSDADGDTFQDGVEVVRGYSPLSEGKLTVTGFKQFCTGSTLVAQHAFPASDVDALCKIGGDILTNVQVMATNAEFYTNLETELTNDCTAFGKIASAACADLVQTLLAAYELSNASS